MSLLHEYFITPKAATSAAANNNNGGGGGGSDIYPHNTQADITTPNYPDSPAQSPQRFTGPLNRSHRPLHSTNDPAHSNSGEENINNSTGQPRPINIVCRYFKSGSCGKGNQCPFSHNLKQEMCYFFQNRGNCSKGNDCPFSHGLDPHN